MNKFCVLLLSVLLAGCAAGPREIGGAPSITLVDAKELPGPRGELGADQQYVYTISPYDRLIIDILGFEELSDRKLDVDGSGRITLPIAGEVIVAGLSPAQAADRIAEQFRRGYVRDPRVSVNVESATSQYVTVEGEVKKPGNLKIVAGMTLLRAIAAAEGATEFARLREVVVHRNVNGKQMVALYDLGAIRRAAYQDPVLYPQDVVVVGESASRRLFQTLLQVSPLLVSPLVAVLDNP